MNLIPTRIEELKSISVLAAARMGWDRNNLAHTVYAEDMRLWAAQPTGELRPDTTGGYSTFGAEWAKFIKGMIP